MAIDRKQMGAAEGLLLQKAEAEIAAGKSINDVLAELKISNEQSKEAEKKRVTNQISGVKAADALEELKKTSKETLSEVKDISSVVVKESAKREGKPGAAISGNVSLENQLEANRETVKQTKLLKEIADNTSINKTSIQDKSENKGGGIGGALRSLIEFPWGDLFKIGATLATAYTAFQLLGGDLESIQKKWTSIKEAYIATEDWFSARIETGKKNQIAIENAISATVTKYEELRDKTSAALSSTIENIGKYSESILSSAKRFLDESGVTGTVTSTATAIREGASNLANNSLYLAKKYSDETGLTGVINSGIDKAKRVGASVGLTEENLNSVISSVDKGATAFNEVVSSANRVGLGSKNTSKQEQSGLGNLVKSVDSYIASPKEQTASTTTVAKSSPTPTPSPISALTATPTAAPIPSDGGSSVFGTIVTILSTISDTLIKMAGGAITGGASLFTGLVSSANTAGLNTRSSISGNDNASKAMNLLTSKYKWSQEQAAGIVGNLQQESTPALNPDARNGSHYGIAQWSTERQGDFKEKYGHAMVGSTLEQQVDFLNFELTEGKENKHGAALKRTSSPEQATIAYHGSERAGSGSMLQKRIGYANNLSIGDASKIFSTALSFKGLKEGVNNKEISSLTNINDPSSTPWCAAFVSGILKKNGYKPSGAPNSAKSYLTYGKEIQLPQAQQGDITVFNRPGGGHVGFYVSHNGNTINVLGGNQGDAVNIASRSIDKKGHELLAIRRLTDAEKLKSSALSNAQSGNEIGTAVGANALGSLGEGIKNLTGIDATSGMSAVGGAVGGIAGLAAGGVVDALKTLSGYLPRNDRIKGVNGPYSPFTTTPLKFSKPLTDANDIINASGRNADLVARRANRPITINSPTTNNTKVGGGDAQSIISYPTRNTDPTLMSYLQMLIGNVA